jgi:hypothetical protein
VWYDFAVGGPLTPEAMVSALLRHAKYEHLGDLEGLMSTLTDNPSYEFHPLGWRVEGPAATREMYRRIIGPIAASAVSSPENRPPPISVAFSDRVRLAEDRLELRHPDGTVGAYRYASAIEFDGDRIVGERLYMDAGLAGIFEAALGSDFGELDGVTRL